MDESSVVKLKHVGNVRISELWVYASCWVDLLCTFKLYRNGNPYCAETGSHMCQSVQPRLTPWPSHASILSLIFELTKEKFESYSRPFQAINLHKGDAVESIATVLITAYHLSLYQCVAIAFRILVLSVRFIFPQSCSVTLCIG